GYQVLSVATGPDGVRHARLQQLHAGVPVFGSEMLVHADGTTFLGSNGVVTRGLAGFDTTPALGAEDAVAIAAADRGAAIRFARQESRLVILPGPDRLGATLAWQVELFNEQQEAADLGRWWYFIAAGDGQAIWKIDGLAHLEQASGPGGNARVARTWTMALDVEKEGEEYLMKTSRQETRDMKQETSGGETAKAAALDGFMDANVNDAHGFTEVTLDMMRDWTGTNSIDNNGFVVIARVHYGKNVDVASWDGQHTNYGDSDPMVRYPRPGALDIVAHEINHGFTEKHSGLVYAEQSGGLNESFSDIAGTMAEYYREGEASDLDIGEDIYIAADGMHRSMCMPASKGQLDHLSQFKAGTGVHTSSGIGNRAFCLTIGRFKARMDSSTTDAVRRAGLAWYAANAAFWTSNSDFKQACQGVVDGARSLGYSKEELTEIAQSWADVGAECSADGAGSGGGGGGGGSHDACDDDDTCEPADGETCSSCAADCDACSADCGRFAQAKCELGIGDCSQCESAGGCGDGVCAADEDDASCGQDCGCAAPDACGSVAPYGCWCDAECGARGDCCADAGGC
ncbi:MAG TPA: M4 family metallopeptidase, partial [Kofleriaceae bacterium]|nr:M4 family metallopeptidase [Kofleriaceae bacterium]